PDSFFARVFADETLRPARDDRVERSVQTQIDGAIDLLFLEQEPSCREQLGGASLGGPEQGESHGRPRRYTLGRPPVYAVRCFDAPSFRSSVEQRREEAEPSRCERDVEDQNDFEVVGELVEG